MTEKHTPPADPQARQRRRRRSPAPGGTPAQGARAGGLGSRRALEQRIADGLVKVNGETAQVGMSVTGGDKIEIDGAHASSPAR